MRCSNGEPLDMLPPANIAVSAAICFDTPSRHPENCVVPCLSDSIEDSTGNTPSEIRRTASALLARFWSDTLLRRIGGAILSAVFLALAVHFAIGLGTAIGFGPAQVLWKTGWLRLDRDGSLPEFLEYTLLLASAAALWGCWHRTRAPIYAALCLAFAVALADNAFMLHERIGRLGPEGKPWIGELVMYTICAIGLGWLILTALNRSALHDRHRGWLVVGGFVALAGFSVVLDAIAAIVSGNSRLLDHGLALVEDGGELIVSALLCVLCLTIRRDLIGR